ncbi:MAG: DUF1294 domain-containing protein [Alphaproteobacteria bacterium]|jgi:uncharacterized membrane protein YsdA (DUF1294 family)|nr:DUF1294 domain-containing protein [Thalassospira sp.]MCE2964594.1 DUF1294 domain-containing protein [Alphaproteobacteria bacterium]
MILALLLLAGVNALAFLLMMADKRAARAQAGRVPERVLLLLALFGGAVGIIAGMRLLRHKTRKAAFYLPVWGILLLQSVLIIAFPKLLIAYY